MKNYSSHTGYKNYSSHTDYKNYSSHTGYKNYYSHTGYKNYSSRTGYKNYYSHTGHTSYKILYFALIKQINKLEPKGSGCGSVGRAVTSDTRGPRFKSSHWQKCINIEHLFTVNCVLKRRK